MDLLQSFPPQILNFENFYQQQREKLYHWAQRSNYQSKGLFFLELIFLLYLQLNIENQESSQMAKRVAEYVEDRFPEINENQDERNNFIQNQFIYQYQSDYDFTQTPRFLSYLDTKHLHQNSISDRKEAINQLMDDFRSIGVQFQEASQHLLQSNKNSVVYEQQQNILDQKSITEILERSITYSSISKSFFFANLFSLNNIKENCNTLKTCLKSIDAEMRELVQSMNRSLKQTYLGIMNEVSWCIGTMMAEASRQINGFIRKEEQANQQIQRLQFQLVKLQRQYATLQEENNDLLNERRQLLTLQIKNEQQSEIIRQLQEHIYSLQCQVKQSQSYCSLISQSIKQSNLQIQKRFEKILEETKTSLTIQVKAELYYKFKNGFILDINSFEEKKVPVKNFTMYSSIRFEQINQVINNLKELNSVLIQRFKISNP